MYFHLGSRKITLVKYLDETIKSKFATIEQFVIAFWKWLGISLIIGSIGGLIGSLFYKSVVMATALREARPYLIFFLPIGGLLIAFLYKKTKTDGENTDYIIDSILLGTAVRKALLPVIFVSTVITHLVGGSAGREGAALQIGGSLGFNVGKVLKLDEKEERLAILSGMSAVFSALFGTPITAAVFALEVCSVGIIHYSGLLPCCASALVAFGINHLFNISPTHFEIATVTMNPIILIKVVALSILCAALSIVFCKSMHISNRLANKYIKNGYIRALIGSVALITLTLLIGNQDYNGGGVAVIANAISNGQAKPFAFVIKLLFTVITLSCGFKGGEIVPTFFIGSTFGCVIAPLLGLDPSFAAAIALIATFCGAVNCPLASIIMSVELFSSGNFIYFAAACIVSYMLSGYTGLYGEQKIVYSKLKAEYINRHTT